MYRHVTLAFPALFNTGQQTSVNLAIKSVNVDPCFMSFYNIRIPSQQGDHVSSDVRI